MITVPEQFARRRVQVSGEAGRAWVDELPSVVEQLCRRWKLTVEGVPWSGEVGLAVPVRRGPQELVLKVSFPDPDSAYEGFALGVWDGMGAVRLVGHDGQWALLLERLDSERSLRSLDVADAITVAALLLRRLAIESPAGPPAQSKTIEHIRQELVAEQANAAPVIPREILNLAITCTESATQDVGVLVNTDLHYDNVLAGTREPWLAIDPKVIIGSVEFGIAPLLWNLRNHFTHRSPSQLFEMIVAAGDFEEKPARQLTILRTVDYWMWALETGLTDDPIMCRQVIEALR